jgi:hypothetical protein
MNKEVKLTLATNLIVIIFIMICAGIVILFNIKTNKRLNQIDKDIRKRPVIEYHYYEDTHQRINSK